MAVPPSIPTSFVPHPAAAGAVQRGGGFSLLAIFAALCYLLLILSLVAAGSVFAYDKLLAGQQAAKDAQLAKAESALDQNTVTDLLRLESRISASKQLLAQHQAYSGIFDLFESVTPANVRFSGLSIASDATTGKTSISAAGLAKSFNTLVAASSDFGDNQLLKNVIFSGIAINKDGSVNFGLRADLDPKLMTFTATSGGVASPVGQPGSITPQFQSATSSPSAAATTTPSGTGKTVPPPPAGAPATTP